MIRSMTGFGKASGEFNQRQFSVEIKSVNSKTLDLNVRAPGEYRILEPELRKHIGTKITRGKCEISVSYSKSEEEKIQQINKEVFRAHHNQISMVAQEQGLNEDALLEILLKMPNVFSSDKAADPAQEEFDFIMKLAEESFEAFDAFRISEGDKMEADLDNNRAAILSLLGQVEALDPARNESVRIRLDERLKTLSEKVNVDVGRFEQEMLYYLEKLDINEEKVRLRGHCEYFTETLGLNEAVGRKLGFIGQEMGREINTLGSKANHTEMQKMVVQMKDYLEKIKEQVLNVL